MKHSATDMLPFPNLPFCRAAKPFLPINKLLWTQDKDQGAAVSNSKKAGRKMHVVLDLNSRTTSVTGSVSYDVGCLTQETVKPQRW